MERLVGKGEVVLKIGGHTAILGGERSRWLARSDIQIGMAPYKEGFPVPCQGDLVQVMVNGKSRQFVVVLRQFIYQSAEEMSIRYVLDTIR